MFTELPLIDDRLKLIKSVVNEKANSMSVLILVISVFLLHHNKYAVF